MSNQYPQGPSYEQYSQHPPVPPFPEGGHPPIAPKPPKKPRAWVWPVISIGTLVLGLVVGAGGSSGTDASSTPQPTVTKTVAGPAGTEVTVTPPPVTKTVPGPKVTVTAPPPQAAAAITEDGVYLVGTDIKPGTYRNGAEDGCYWERLSNTSGDFDAIIANGNGGNQVVTIKRTDKAFSTQRCGEWRKVG